VGDNPRKIKYSRGAEKDGILDPFESGGSLWALLVARLIHECARRTINGPSELARTSPQGGGLDLSLTARIDRARPLI
jgi:hypothetical protein